MILPEDIFIEPRKFGYSEIADVNIGMLGFGNSAHSHLRDRLIYKDANDDYLNFDEDKKFFMGIVFSRKRFVKKNFFII